MPFERSEFEPFRCKVERARASVYVRPIGELDLATVPTVEAELTELWSLGSRASRSISATSVSSTRRRCGTRAAEPPDRRAHKVRLTPAGERNFAAAQRSIRDLERELLAPLAPADRITLRASLARLAGA